MCGVWKVACLVVMATALQTRAQWLPKPTPVRITSPERDQILYIPPGSSFYVSFQATHNGSEPSAEETLPSIHKFNETHWKTNDAGVYRIRVSNVYSRDTSPAFCVRQVKPTNINQTITVEAGTNLNLTCGDVDDFDSPLVYIWKNSKRDILGREVRFHKDLRGDLHLLPVLHSDEDSYTCIVILAEPPYIMVASASYRLQVLPFTQECRNGSTCLYVPEANMTGRNACGSPFQVFTPQSNTTANVTTSTAATNGTSVPPWTLTTTEQSETSLPRPGNDSDDDDWPRAVPDKDMINDCQPFPCLNGGTCQKDKFSHWCSCPHGYSGSRCEVNDTPSTTTPATSPRPTTVPSTASNRPFADWFRSCFMNCTDNDTVCRSFITRLQISTVVTEPCFPNNCTYERPWVNSTYLLGIGTSTVVTRLPNVSVECVCRGPSYNESKTNWNTSHLDKWVSHEPVEGLARTLNLMNVTSNTSVHCSCQDGSNRNINIIKLPGPVELLTRPGEFHKKNGSAVNFTCQVDAHLYPSVNVTWFKNDKPVDCTTCSQTDPGVLELRSVTVWDIGTYRCNVSDNSSSVSASGFLMVYYPLEIRTRPPRVQDVGDGDKINLTVYFNWPKPQPNIDLKSPETKYFFRNESGHEVEIAPSCNRIRENDCWMEATEDLSQAVGDYSIRVITVFSEVDETVKTTARRKYSIIIAGNSVSVALGIVFGLVGLLGAGLIIRKIYLKRRTAQPRTPNPLKGKGRGDRHSLSTLHSNSYSTLPRDPDDFPMERLHLLEVLGSGNFGKVLRAEALDILGTGQWNTIAVKVCKDHANEPEKEDFLHELCMMKKIPPHVNVVSYLGKLTGTDPVMILMEYVPGGNLLEFLRQHRHSNYVSRDGDDAQPATPQLLTSFALQAARGLQHIANQGIIHRDVAARNILISENNTVKVADLGLARDLSGNEAYERSSRGPLPIRWMSPESLISGLYTSRSDVWSFGVLLWEIVTLGASPYPGLSPRQVMNAVVEGKILERPDNCSKELYSVMTSCWRMIPSSRPDWSELVSTLEGMLEEQADYFCLDDFQDNIYTVLDPNTVEERL